ncbi:13130_t:CDS:2 [Funneliformis geosporum]|nr:13130_t:CDS:2 [Funneliformis geosporum]
MPNPHDGRIRIHAATQQIIRLRQHHDSFESASHNRHQRIWTTIATSLLNGGFVATSSQWRYKWYSLKFYENLKD